MLKFQAEESQQQESIFGGRDEPDFYIDVQTKTKYHECYCCHVPELAHNVIKFILFSFNVLFWIISFILVIIGIWAIAVNADYGNAVSGVLTPSLLLVVLGVVIFLVSFAGCVGALRENTYLLKAVSIFLLVFHQYSYNYYDKFLFQFIAIMGIGIILQLIFVIVVFTLNGRVSLSDCVSNDYHL